MKRLLVPVDFSEGTDRILSTVVTLARGLRAEVILLHVAPPEPEFISFEPGPPSVRAAVAREISAEHQKLHQLERGLKEQGIAVTALLVQGYTVEKILQEIERLRADLVIMGSHGHGVLRHLLLGSVSEGVVKRSPVPVLIVPTRSGK